ncbi:hypothetical protein [Achromobacter pestifer]
MNAIEKKLVKSLNPLLEGKGFVWSKSREMYIRKRRYGFDSLVWTCHPDAEEGGRLQIGPVLGVRHDEVDDLVNQLPIVYGEDNKKYTTTVSRVLVYFPFRPASEPQYIRLSNVDGDVALVVENILKIFEIGGDEFFTK